MPLSRSEWHQRFLLQAQWTEALRLYFYDLIKDQIPGPILDIGCGTGAILTDLEALTAGDVFGADLNHDRLVFANTVSPETDLVGADVHHLPFPEQSFGLVVCHYFLMWAGDPEHALQEILRIVKSGGFIVAFAEPDYGGRIDYPEAFSPIRKAQINSLLKSGADPRMGRKLSSLFHALGLSDIQCGVYQGLWTGKQSPEELRSEWKILTEDLAGSLDESELQNLEELEKTARESGSRLIYVPTFYAWGKVH